MNNSFVSSVGKLFDYDRIIIYLLKSARQEIANCVHLCHVIRWKEKAKGNLYPVEFILHATTYASVIKPIALNKYKIKILACHGLGNLRDDVRKVMRMFYHLSVALFAFTSLRARQEKHTVAAQAGISCSYAAGNGTDLNYTERCEFPWLLKCDVPKSRIVVKFRRKDIYVDDAILQPLKQRGITYLTFVCDKSNLKDVPFFRPSVGAWRIMIRYFVKMFVILLRQFVSFKLYNQISAVEIFEFIFRYAISRDYYLRNNIKIDVEVDVYEPLKIAEQQALSDVGGISVNYQYCQWNMPDICLSSSADVTFVFGPLYADIIRRSKTESKNIINMGYITDYSFSAVKKNSEEMRSSLIKNGACFIVSYFDENSSDDRMSMIPNSVAANIYKELCEWVLKNDDVGLICSPKCPRTLMQRLQSVKDIIEEAKSTGRCIFMDWRHHTYTYPTEPAQASDLVIGSLMGGTTALESYLSGVRTIYLDLEGLYSYPEYEWGADLVVFDKLQSLIYAIDEYRFRRHKSDEIGNIKYIKNLNEKDSFRDGQAAERMGQYIGWLFECVNNGKDKATAIAYSNEHYARRWGQEQIIVSDAISKKQLPVEALHAALDIV